MTNTFAFIRGDSYRWSPAYGWQLVAFEEVEPFVRKTVQTAFDQHAAAVGRITGDYRPQPVRGNVVADTWRAMQQLCAYEVAPTAQTPFWLGDSGGWGAEDVLTFPNWFLNVREWIAGRECIRKPSPDLFYDHTAPFDFDPEAPEPVEWHRFLASLEMGDDWIQFLREVMGYALWPAYDLQKFFVMVGPRRSGKGTIASVLERLVGGPRAVCALNIEDFASDFGLEPALGKRLCFVPECFIPQKKVYAVVANIKAITGSDLVQVKRKGIRNLSVRLLLKLFLSTNEFLPLPDNSGALEARTIPIRLNKSFFGREDQGLSAKLAAESPGILLWALEGLRTLYGNDGRFDLPESTLEEMRQLADEVAPLRPFIEDACTVDHGVACHSSALYATYLTWATTQGQGELLSETRFASAIRATVPGISKDRAPNPNAENIKGRKIVPNSSNAKHGRPPVWLGIAPRA